VSKVDVVASPQLRQAVLSRQLLKQSCEQCGELVETQYPFLYQDANNRLLVYYVPTTRQDVQQKIGEALAQMNEQIAAGTLGLGTDAAFDYQFRVVATYDELLDKILVREHGLDDRIIELMKLSYLGRLRGNPVLEQLTGFYFGEDEDADPAGPGKSPIFYLLFADGQVGTSVFHQQVYDELAANFQARISETPIQGFRVVDQSWAMEVFTQMAGFGKGQEPEPQTCPGCH